MENEEILDGIELSADQLKEIEKQAAELKAANTDVRVVFPILVEGMEEDGKELYIGYFRQPNFKTFSKYLSVASRDNAVAMRTLAKDCFLGGDREMVDDDSLFLFGTMGQLGKIIEMRNGRLVNLSKTRK